MAFSYIPNIRLENAVSLFVVNLLVREPDLTRAGVPDIWIIWTQ